LPIISKLGRVIWITGLSGAGKSTVGQRVAGALWAKGKPAVFLDGDRLRSVLGAGSDGFDAGDRRKLAFVYARLCRELADQGLDVVCATVSMFHEIRRWNRAEIPTYLEVYLKVPLDELRRRDPKGHYAKNDALVGVHIAAEEPENPDLIIDNFGATDAIAAAGRILARLEETQR
jgi:cytidine diphosphoramidate kinase